MKTRVPKLLVLGNSLPWSKYGGGVVRGEILEQYPKDKFVCYSIASLKHDCSTVQCDELLKDIPHMVRPLIPHLTLRGARFYRPLLRAIGYLVIAPYRIKEAVQFCRKHEVELIWTELQGDVLVLVEEISSRLNIPFVGTVWDDPEGWFQDGGYDSFSRRILHKKFREALAKACKISTAGEAMQREYKKEFGVDSVILRHGFAKPAYPRNNKTSNDDIIIGFVGNPYGRDAWMAFLSAISNLNNLKKYPEIRMKTFGTNSFPFNHNGVQIELRGWQSSEVMLQELSEIDFCYLPYWFNQAKRRHVELSFPNKFETYMAAGRPVLFHGPDYAGISDSIKQYDVGIGIHSLNEKEIIKGLNRFISDQSFKESCSNAAYNAFHSQFNCNKMLESFSILIETDAFFNSK